MKEQLIGMAIVTSPGWVALIVALVWDIRDWRRMRGR